MYVFLFFLSLRPTSRRRSLRRRYNHAVLNLLVRCGMSSILSQKIGDTCFIEIVPSQTVDIYSAGV